MSGNTTAGTSATTNRGGTVDNGIGGLTEFSGAATAKTTTFPSEAGTANLGRGGTVNFRNNSSAGSGVFTQAGSGVSGAGTSLAGEL